jgi:hypothetical protein
MEQILKIKPADDFLHRKRDDEDLTESLPTIYKGGIVFSENKS